MKKNLRVKTGKAIDETYRISFKFNGSTYYGIKGVQFERWNHAHGCRKWFNLVRDTSNDEIKSVYKMGEEPPIE